MIQIHYLTEKNVITLQSRKGTQKLKMVDTSGHKN
jgi:hypothetical protein